MVRILSKIAKCKNKNEQPKLVELFIKTTSLYPIRLIIIFDAINRQIEKKIILNESCVQKLRGIPNNILDVQKEFKEKYDDEQYDLEDWNGLHKNFDN